MEKKKIAILVIALLFVIAAALYIRGEGVQEALLGVFGIDSGAVTLEMQASDRRVKVGEEIKLEIYVTSAEQAINAVGYEIEFDKDLVEVLSTDSEGSFCELFPEDIIEDSSVRYSCGLPTPGFTGKDGLVGSIKLEAIASGRLEVVFGENTQVLANDGLGTDILSESNAVTVVIK